uniref:IGFBP N-terminal domain-containing protein n=1 Tax=Elaeophora elaphi TaxID=1147741 RepID=A0A0R3RK03_9BILA
MAVTRLHQFYYFIILIQLFFTIYAVFLPQQQQQQQLVATIDNSNNDNETEYYTTKDLFVIDSLSTVCGNKCPNFCPNPELLNCAELAEDPCECCTVCLHDAGDLCGPGIGACRHPNFCQPKLDQNGIGICSG